MVSPLSFCFFGVQLDRPKYISEQNMSKSQEIHRLLRIRAHVRLQSHPRCSLVYFEDTIEHPCHGFLAPIF